MTVASIDFKNIFCQIKVQKLEEHLMIERQKNEESTFQVELLRKEVTLHEYVFLIVIYPILLVYRRMLH